MDDYIDTWEKAWNMHGKVFHVDAYEEEEEDEDQAPPENTSRPEGLGKGPGFQGGGDGVMEVISEEAEECLLGLQPLCWRHLWPEQRFQQLFPKKRGATLAACACLLQLEFPKVNLLFGRYIFLTAIWAWASAFGGCCCQVLFSFAGTLPF